MRAERRIAIAAKENTSDRQRDVRKLQYLKKYCRGRSQEREWGSMEVEAVEANEM
jgi:hypothetical protein